LNKFRVAFASLLTFAMVTSALAGWGLVGSPSPFSSLSGGPAASTSSAGSVSMSTHNPSSQSSEVVSTTTAAQSASTTLVTTSVQTSSSTVNSATVTGTTITSTAAGGAVTTITTVLSSATAVVTTTVAGQTVTAATTAAAPGALNSLVTGFGSQSRGESLLAEAQGISLFLAPVSWILLGGAWIWRGRVRSRYTEMGFGSDVFELFMKMKGGATRIKVLNTLSTPKDRLQLAEELGVDWKTVDRHVQILNRYGFVREQAAYGTVRLYEVTPIGRMLLNLFDDLERNDGAVTQQPRATPRRQEDDRPDP